MALPSLLIACGRAAPMECGLPRSLGWQPVVADVARSDGASARWDVQGDATLGDESGCASQPCVTWTGAGAVETRLVLTPGQSHTLNARITSHLGVVVAVLEEGDDGVLTPVASTAAASGNVDLAWEFALPDAGARAVLTFDGGGGGVTIQDFAVTTSAWTTTDAVPAAVLRLGVLLQVDPGLAIDRLPDRVANEIAVLDGLSGGLATHGFGLTVLADEGFVATLALQRPELVPAVEWGARPGPQTDADELAASFAAMHAVVAAAGGTMVVLGGGFDAGPEAWSKVQAAGASALTDFTDRAGGWALDAAYESPWTPPDGTGNADPVAFTVDDPEGPLPYLPVVPVREVDPVRLPGFVGSVLGQEAAHARPGWVNGTFLVVRPDDLGDLDLPDFGDANALPTGLGAWDSAFSDVVDPLLASGAVVPTGPAAFAGDFAAWASGGCPTE